MFLRRLATLTKPFQVFDRAQKTIQKNRSALNPEASRKADYLRDEVALRTIERLAFITRDFTRTLDLGAHLGNFLRALCTSEDAVENPTVNGENANGVNSIDDDKRAVREKIQELVMVELAEALLYRDSSENFSGRVTRVVADEEAFDHPELQKSEQFDAVVSNLLLHWINDLPAALANIHRVLKPDGLFMGTLFGGDTLYELRTSLQLAELERLGGMSPRVSPLVKLQDIGSLMNRAGFSMLTIDTEDIVVGGFPDLVSMMRELQEMGEQNSLITRAHLLPRDVLLAANEICKSLHGEKGEDGITLPATFNVIFMIGWKKSDTQPQPLERGSGQVSLKDVL